MPHHQNSIKKTCTLNFGSPYLFQFIFILFRNTFQFAGFTKRKVKFSKQTTNVNIKNSIYFMYLFIQQFSVKHLILFRCLGIEDNFFVAFEKALISEFLKQNINIHGTHKYLYNADILCLVTVESQSNYPKDQDCQIAEQPNWRSKKKRSKFLSSR